MNGAQVHWLPIPGVKEFITAALREYLFRIRPEIMRKRKAQGLPDHPFLFVSSGKSQSFATGETGAPYMKAAFRSAWKRALGRLKRKYCDPILELRKSNGTTPHGARHFYGAYLKALGHDGDLIQRCMHHFSPFSHLAYSQLTSIEINDILSTGGRHNPATGFGSVTEALKRQFDKGSWGGSRGNF